MLNRYRLSSCCSKDPLIPPLPALQLLPIFGFVPFVGRAGPAWRLLLQNTRRISVQFPDFQLGWLFPASMLALPLASSPASPSSTCLLNVYAAMLHWHRTAELSCAANHAP